MNTESGRDPGGADSPIIRLRDIELTLSSASGPVNILRGIDLDVSRGQSVAVVGPSGSGKSSLLAITGGLERPTSGTVCIDGQELSNFDEDALARFRGRRIGIVFQSFHLVPTMTALENVAIPLELARAADPLHTSKDILQAVGLESRARHLPSELSGGEQQRVALARALVIEPVLLLADEPTGNLDQSTGETVIDMMFSNVKRTATTLLLVTHNPELAALCDRIVHIEDGRLYDES